jgi:N-acetylglucosamine-6-phosphate deacetylase
VRLVTLAPECDAGLATTSFLARHGVTVSAGHCDPSLDELRAAIDAGLSMVTHLGNGCPLLLHRHDNILQRVLAADRLRWVMLIPDAVHLPPTLVRTIIRAVGIDRVIAVTDATAAGGMGAGRFSLAGHEVVVDAEGAAWAPGRSHLVGSTAGMDDVRRVLAALPGFAAEDVERLTATNPRLALAGG